MRKAATAPHSTMLTLRDGYVRVSDARRASATSAMNAMVPARPSMPSSMLNALIAPTMATQVNAAAPARKHHQRITKGTAQGRDGQIRGVC